jgi:hypothetical protein
MDSKMAGVATMTASKLGSSWRMPVVLGGCMQAEPPRVYAISFVRPRPILRKLIPGET